MEFICDNEKENWEPGGEAMFLGSKLISLCLPLQAIKLNLATEALTSAPFILFVNII